MNYSKIRTVLPKLLPNIRYSWVSSFHCSVPLVRSSSDHAINDECIEQYQQNGVVCLRGLFSQYWVDKVRVGIRKVLSEPSEYSEKIKSKEGIYFNDYYQWRRIEEFCEYIRSSPAANISATLLGTKDVAFYHEHVFVKESFNESETPWHQDQSYYPIDGWQGCSIWMPVTPVEATSCLHFIKGSHKWGKWFIPRKFETNTNYNIENESKERNYETIPVIKEDDYHILSWDMEPGDCIVFHMRCVHGSSSSSSSTDRQTLATRWLGDDATLARRPWKPSPPTLPSDIKYGELIKNSKEYEVLPNTWSR